MQETTLITGASFIRKAGLAGLFAASCLTAPTWALAQQAAAPLAASQAPVNSLGEIVVTARRRSERLQDVPVSVVALNAQQLDQQGVKNASDLSRVAPGLSIQSTASNRADTTYSIRGQGQTFGQSSPGVVAYFAEVPDFASAIYDLQSVQVLKGPQGTLFGRNTEGGAILFTPHAATNDWEGFIDTRLGNYNRRDLEFAVGGPIIQDKVMFRIAGQSLNRDGFTTYQLDGAKLDNEDRQSYRAILTLKPFEGFENTTIYQANWNQEKGSGAVLSKVTAPIDGQPGASAALLQQLAMQQALGIRTVLGDDPLHFVRRDNQGWLNTTSWRLNEHLTFKNIVSDRNSQGGQSYDLDATNLTLLHVNNPVSVSHEITEEFQAQLSAGPVSGVLGYYYEHNWSPHQIGFRIQEPSSGLGPLAAFGPIADIEVLGQSASSSQAVFGQADWKVTDKLTLTAGVRETQDPVQSGPQTTLFLDPLVPPPFGPQLTLSQSGVLRHTFSAATWNVAATYKIDPELNVYGTIRRGFKEGGFNGTAQNAADRFFQPEFDTDYEFGIKGQHDIGGVRTRFDVDGFYDDYTGIQRFENIVESGIPQTLTKNVGVGSIAGVDVDFTAIANEYFRVSLNYTYLDAKYSKFDDVADGNPKSSRFPNTPSHQLTVTPMVTIPVPSHFGELTAQANIYHQSSIATDPFNVPNGFYSVDADSPGANIPGYTRVDLRADWRHIYGSSVSAALFVQNVADTKYVIGSNNQLNAATMTVADLYGEPRFFGIELRYDFGR